MNIKYLSPIQLGQTAIVCFLLVGVVTFIWSYWCRHFERLPLREFGMESVHHVLKFEPNDVRATILNRGWMTSAEWVAINKRQAKAAKEELRRRGVSVE
jgi:hypothetical protein